MKKRRKVREYCYIVARVGPATINFLGAVKLGLYTLPSGYQTDDVFGLKTIRKRVMAFPISFQMDGVIGAHKLSYTALFHYIQSTTRTWVRYHDVHYIIGYGCIFTYPEFKPIMVSTTIDDKSVTFVYLDKVDSFKKSFAHVIQQAAKKVGISVIPVGRSYSISYRLNKANVRNVYITQNCVMYANFFAGHGRNPFECCLPELNMYKLSNEIT